MEKLKTPRSVQEIGNDYQQLCLKAGDIAYKIDVYKRDLALLTEQMRDLNFEAVASQEAANKAKAEEATPKLEAVTETPKE